MSGRPQLADPATGEVREWTREGAEQTILELRDHIRGLERNLAGWAHRCADLERDRLAEAQRSHLWPLAVQWHEHHNKVTGRRSKWSLDKFERAEPFLKGYGIEVCMAASEGLAFDHFSKQRANGTTVHYNTWETLLKNTDRFEECVNRAPLDVLARLKADGLLPGQKKKRKRDAQTTLDAE